MYNNYLYLIFIPLFILTIFVLYKFIFAKFVQNFLQKRNLQKQIDENVNYIENTVDRIEDAIEDGLEKIDETVEEATEDIKDSLLDAKIIILNFFYDVADNLKFYSQKYYAFFLHFLVLAMKFIRDFTDGIYARSRDKFLETATKEKSTVNIFWKHLKEYKKEADKEEKEEGK
jgi:phosphatidylglycerophosphate synthase